MIRFLVPVAFGLSALFFTHLSVAGETRDEREQQLAIASQDESLSIEQRAHATATLGEYSGANALIAVGRASRSEFVDLRVAAIMAASQWQGKARWDVIEPLLSDDVVGVRNTALFSLLPHWKKMTPSYQAKLTFYVDSYLAKLTDSLDDQLEFAWIEMSLGDHQSALARLEMLHSTTQQTRVAIGYANLLRRVGDNQSAKVVLKQAIQDSESNAQLHYQLGLIHYAEQNQLEATRLFQQAHQLEPSNNEITYVYAISLSEQAPKQAETLFNDLYRRTKDPVHLYALCDVQLANGEEGDECLNTLRQVAPKKVVEQLIQQHKQDSNHV